MTRLRFAIIGVAAIFIGIALAEATAPAFFGTTDEYKGPMYKVGVPKDHMVDEEGKSFVTIETSTQKTYTGELAISEALNDEVVVVINTNLQAIKDKHEMHARLYIVGLVTAALGLILMLYSLFRNDILAFFTKEKKDAQ
jgi:hypothetical protein